MLQVYTSVPLPFGGLTLRPRRMVNWQLYHLMQTLLEVHLALNEGDPARNALLARLDTAYNMLDLREGWQGERFADSAQAAYEYLFKEYPTINRGSTSRGAIYRRRQPPADYCQRACPSRCRVDVALLENSPEDRSFCL